ncbi:MAG: hypothetical protein AAF609_02140 [Cyanobacteria bacterium P01_C01_bin.120]
MGATAFNGVTTEFVRICSESMRTVGDRAIALQLAGKPGFVKLHQDPVRFPIIFRDA